MVFRVPARATGTIVMAFEKIRMKESSGRDDLKADTSSATGRYQFISPTWNLMANTKEGKEKNIPSITPEMEEYSKINNRPHPEDPRLNPEFQEIVMRMYTKENADKLKNAGIEPSDKNLYIMHFMGEGDGMKLLKGLSSGREARRDFSAAAGSNPTIFRPGRDYKDVYDIQTRSMTDDTKTGYELIREKYKPEIEALDSLKAGFPSQNMLLGNVEETLMPKYEAIQGNMYYNLNEKQDSNVRAELPFGQEVNMPNFENKLMPDPLRGFFDYVRSGGIVSPKLRRSLKKGGTYVPNATRPRYADETSDGKQ
jgi:hypothetical protein